MITFENKALACSDCNTSFLFSADEQQFFAIKGLLNEPKRCPDCRVITRLKREGKEPDSSSKVHCADCGVLSVVPFKPTGRKPVYCGACFRDHSRNAYSDQRQLVPAG
jgi:CxxC-x17-CxxC domain-containing protein